MPITAIAGVSAVMEVLPVAESIGKLFTTLFGEINNRKASKRLAIFLTKRGEHNVREGHNILARGLQASDSVEVPPADETIVSLRTRLEALTQQRDILKLSILTSGISLRSGIAEIDAAGEALTGVADDD